MKNKISLISASLTMLFIGGCSTASKHSIVNAAHTDSHSSSVAQSASDDQANASDLLKQLQTENSRLSRENEVLTKSNSNLSSGIGDNDLLPPAAKPGECYARVLTPSKYATKTERVVKKPESYRMEVVPPKYTWAEEKVLVKDASEKLRVEPARYQWENESVLVQEASEKMISIPAKYKTVHEKILVKPAYSTWKKGKGPIQKVDNATGEIMCLVEVPAEYKTVIREELVEPATTKKIAIPAEYKIIKKYALAEPEKVVKVSVPAQYRTIKVKKVLEPAKEQRIDIPAVYGSVTKRTKISDSILEWRPILCETNTNPNVIRRLQQALSQAGFNPGEVDAQIGPQTISALSAYQRSKGLASGQITMETLKSLGVSY